MRKEINNLGYRTDCIIREAFSRRLTLLDLRLICNRDEDFANPIEPSVLGGAKIARAIAAFAASGMPPGSRGTTTVGMGRSTYASR
jgi:hypothetical protein